MRVIESKDVTEAVSALFQGANFLLPEDVKAAIRRAREAEQSPAGRQVLDTILENAELAARERRPLCQDTGSAVVFLELGQEVNITGGGLIESINEGVRQAYTDGYLRKSIVSQPFSARVNTRDNTPAIVHTDIVPGDSLRITVLPKGAGSENMTRLGMLSPGQGREGVIEFVLKSVEEAGSNPCPPLVIGVGVGGTAEMALLLAKKALCQKVDRANPDGEIAGLERDILRRVNDLGIGPMGYGGSTTALAVHVLAFPSHIASLPVGVSLQCHSARYREAVL